LKLIIKILTLVVALAGLSLAQSEQPSPRETFNQKHQAGIRLGGWSNRGSVHPTGGSNATGFSFETKINSGSFYFEGFYDYRLTPYLAGEGSLGLVNRGSVTINQGFLTDIGNLQLYAALVQIKLYPMASLKPKFQPYLTLGGGIYYAWRNVQLTTAVFTNSGFEQESATRLGYSFGGGLDWPIANSFGLDLNFRYMPIKFSEPIVTVNDYTAFTLALGVKYLYASGK
jgi:opacity protein-like surface antigen